MNKNPKCTCGMNLHLVESGYMRYNIRPDGTKGHMFMGQPDNKEKFLICGNIKCNKQFKLWQNEGGKLFRMDEIRREL